MKRLVTLTTALLLALTLAGAPAKAGDEPLPELVLEKVETTLYKELYVAETAYEYGLRETLKIEGRVLAAVKAAVQPKWTEEIDSLRVDYQDIRLVLENGEAAPMLGRFDRYGEFRMDADSFSEWRPSEWKENPAPEFYNAVFALPAGTTAAEFRLGPKSVKVQFAGQPQDPPDPRDPVSFEITAAGYVEAVPNSHHVGDLEPYPVTSVQGLAGLLLEVKIKVTPKTGNGDDPDHFFWYTPWIGLLTTDGQYVTALGEMFMEGLNDNVSHNLSRSSGGEFSSGEAVFYFSVPQGTGSFKLTYMSLPVAEAKVQPPAPQPAAPGPTPEEKAKSVLENIFEKAKKK
ncbi:MAG: hypothetical protein AB1896_19030 [Thermodesulfobacteriota bacterium]